MLTFICYPKCATCQKAKALLDSYHAQYEIRDIKTDNPSYDELKEWLTLSGLPVRRFFNTSGSLYKSLGLKDKLESMDEDECLKLLATDGMLVKRPLLVDEYRALVGFKQNEWEAVFEYDRKITDKIFGDYFNEMLRLIELKEIADKSPYKVRVVSTNDSKVAIQNNDIQLFYEATHVINYATVIMRIHGCRNIALYRVMFDDEFFDLSSGLIVETEKRLADSGIRLAIIGDLISNTDKPLQDFIHEINNGRHLYFVADEDEALSVLGDR